MKKFLALLFISIMICLTFTSLALAEQKPQTILVCNFDNCTYISELGNIASSQVASRLQKIGGNYKVISTEKARSIIGDQWDYYTGFSQIGLSASEMNRLRNADIDFLVTGTVLSATNKSSGFTIYGIGRTSAKSVVELRVCIVEIATGNIKSDISVKGVNRTGGAIIGDIAFHSSSDQESAYVNALDDATHNVMVELSSLFPLQTLVASVNSGTVVINAGTNAGVKKGDEFMIYSEGEPILDPLDPSKILDVNKIQKGTLVIDYVGSVSSSGKIKKSKTAPEVEVRDIAERTKIKK